MRINVLNLILVLLFLIVELVGAVDETKTDKTTNVGAVDETKTDKTTTADVVDETKPNKATNVDDIDENKNNDETDVGSKKNTTTTETTNSSTKIKPKSNTNSTKSKTEDDEEDNRVEFDKEHSRPFISEQFSSVKTDNTYADIHCLYEREKQCEIFEDQLKSILKKIDDIFVIKEQIKMSLFLMDLTNVCKDCLGIVLPPSFVYLKEVGSDKVYSYPQALARQLNFEGKDKLDFATMDFTMVINVDQSDEDIKTFGEFALAREILHGMGITTSGDLANSNGYEQLFSEDFYAPQRHPSIKVTDDIDGIFVKFEKFYPLSIYEKYIVTQSNPNDYIFQNLTDMYKVPYPPQEYYKFMNDTEELDKTYLKESYQQFVSSSFYEPAKRIAQLYKQKGSVGFKAADGSVIPLQTFNGDYYKSVSVNHIDIPKMSTYFFYDYDPFNKNEIKNYLNEDFILNYTYMFMYKLKTIKSIVGKDNKYGIFGPGVIKILTTLGWKLKDDKKSKNDPTISANLKYQVATEVNIPFNNYYDELMRVSDKHDYFGYGSLANYNMVCDVKAYAFTLLAIGLAFGL